MATWKLERRQPSASAPHGACIICAIPFEKETPKLACYDCFLDASSQDKEQLTQLSLPRVQPAPVPANLKVSANGVTASLTVLPKAQPTLAAAFQRSRQAQPKTNRKPTLADVAKAVEGIKTGPGTGIASITVSPAGQSLPAIQVKPSLFTKILGLVNEYPTVEVTPGKQPETPSQTRERIEAMAFAENLLANRVIPEQDKPSVAIAVAKAWLSLDAAQRRFVLLDLD